MRPRVFIDGHAGTAGLRIRSWLADRDDLELLTLSEAQRKDAGARRDALLGAEIAVLCLPDESAREVVRWVEGARVRLLDASSAHRVAEGWVYGLPELARGQRAQIRAARRVSNPGCYPTAVVLLLRPLVDAGLVARDAPLSIHALSGYSGGGNALIARWEDPSLGLQRLVYEAPYSLERVHKHVPEMQRFAGLAREPHFVPAVGPFRCGMRVELPLHADLLARGATGKAVWESIAERYRGERFVRVAAYAEPVVVSEGTLDPQAANDTNRIDLHVLPHPSGHLLLIAVLDNLGKGAAGAAIQNLNLMLGLDEARGLPA
jgi:N-acetyl-gamma-glutamyl-phosphate reductase